MSKTREEIVMPLIRLSIIGFIIFGIYRVEDTYGILGVPVLLGSIYLFFLILDKIYD